jgi:hypothetical protein
MDLILDGRLCIERWKPELAFELCWLFPVPGQLPQQMLRQLN